MSEENIETNSEVEKTSEQLIEEHIKAVDEKVDEPAPGEPPKADAATSQSGVEVKQQEQPLPTEPIDPEAVQSEPVPFEPDLTYTFRGKKHEMPDYLKGVIDNEEKQAFFQDLFSKAEGLDIIKNEGMRWQQNFEAIENNVVQFAQAWNSKNFSKALEFAELYKPTIGEAMSGLGFTREDVVKYAYELAQMSPEQYQDRSQVFETDQRYNEISSELEKIKNDMQRREVNSLASETSAVLQDPELTPLIEAFDAKNGEGAFREEIILRGQQIYRLENGRVAPPRELANAIVNRYNLRSLVSQPAANTQPSQPARSNPKTVPVIPAVEPGGGSPGTKEITSLKDIQKEFKEEYGQELQF